MESLESLKKLRELNTAAEKNLNSLSFAAEEQIEMTDERLAPRGPNPVA